MIHDASSVRSDTKSQMLKPNHAGFLADVISLFHSSSGQEHGLFSTATPSRPHQFIALDADTRRISPCDGGANMSHLLRKLWNDEGQDIAEYAVMLAVILVLVVGTIRLAGSNANNAFSSAASSIQ